METSNVKFRGRNVYECSVTPGRDEREVGQFVTAYVGNEFLFNKDKLQVNYYQLEQHCYRIHNFIEALLRNDRTKINEFGKHFEQYKDTWEENLYALKHPKS